MNFKKYVFAMVCSAVVMFTCITFWFIPLKSSADVDWGYYGITEGMPYNWTDFKSYPNYDTRTANFFTKSVGKNYLLLTTCYSNSTGDFIAFTTVDYDTVTATKVTNKITLYFTNTYYWQCTFCLTKKSISMSGGNFNGTDSRSNYSVTIPDTYTAYVSDKYITAVDTDLDIVGLTKNLLSNLWNDGTIFGDNYDMIGILPYDIWSGKFADTINRVGNDYLDYLKALLSIDNTVSSSEVEQIFLDIDSNNYDNNSYLVDIDTDKRTQLTNTWNNYKKFINNSVTYDTVNNIYKPNTSYLNTVYNSSNYFQNYILGDSLNTFDIVSALNIISGQLNGTILNALVDIKGGITALGGVFATAINTAFADLHLDSLIGDINTNLDKIDDSLTTINNNVTVGNSINNSIKNNIDTDNSSDDDTTLIGKLNLSLKKLGDDITTKLGDINLNIKNITNNNPTIGDSNSGTGCGDCNHDTEDDDFWKEVQSRLSTKIPLYKQCVDLISPITSVKYDDALGSHDDYLLEDIDTSGTELTASVQSIDNDGQLDIYTRYYLGDLVVVSYNDMGEPTGLKIPFNNPDWNVEEYVLDTTSYTSSKYKGIFSDIFLTVCYIAFAWSIVHRLSVWFGRSRSDNANNDTVER